MSYFLILQIMTHFIYLFNEYIIISNYRMKVTQEDFVKAKEKTLYRKRGNIPEGLYL